MGISALPLIVLFCILFLGLLLGIPIAFCLGGAAVVTTLLFIDVNFLVVVINKAFELCTSFILLAIPLFVLMANILLVSGIAESIFDTVYVWASRIKGSLAIGAVIVCTLIAAMAGNVAAGTLSGGLLSLNSMRRHGYDDELAMGTVLASGTLGILIPPSVIAIMYAALANESTGRLFAGGIFSGLLLSTLFIIYILVRCASKPSLAPSAPAAYSWGRRVTSLRGIILPLALIVAVLGSIFSGAATPTEAAAVGVMGAFICGIVNRKLSWQGLKQGFISTFGLCAMIFWMIIGAGAFVSVYCRLGATGLISALIAAMPVSPWVIIVMMVSVLIILGMFIDPTGILLICAPIFTPIVEALGFSLVWFGIIFIIAIQIGYLTPPFGYSLFYMRGMSPDATTESIYHSIIPYVGIMIVGIILIGVFPQIALWLPSLIF